jgi:hypothetical protein
MPKSDRLKEAAGKSGKPLEVSCAREFLSVPAAAGASRAWKVSVGSYYKDILGNRENPIRELDVLARRDESIQLGDSRVDVHLDVVLSCKGFPNDRHPVTFSVSREAVPEDHPPLLLNAVQNPGSRSRLGYEACELLLYEMGLQRKLELQRTRRIIGFGIFKESPDPNQEWTGEGDKNLYEGMDSAFRAAVFWWTRSGRNRLSVRLVVPVLVVSKPWDDFAIDTGALGIPTESDVGYVANLYPYKRPVSDSSPEPLFGLVVAIHKVPALVGTFERLFDWLRSESASAYRSPS